jgi:hypothetical protein
MSCHGKAMHDLGERLPFTTEHFLELVERERRDFEQLMDIIQDRPNDYSRFMVDALIRFSIYLRTWALRN